MKTLREVLAEDTGGEAKYPNTIQSIIDDEMAIAKQVPAITDRNAIPDTKQIPLENPTTWFRVRDVTCCFVDMEGSTKLSASQHPNSTAKLYRLFTGTAIKIFHSFDAPYIDVKGDGIFAMFDRGQEHRALVATVTFKSFVKQYFTPQAEKLTEMSIGGHFGIDRRTVLVRRLGLRRMEGRTDRQNEVWAGKPVNMAAKLASLSSDNKLLVSNRFHSRLSADEAINSCGCYNNGVSTPLWSEVDLSEDDRFDFDTAYALGSDWCVTHGRAYAKRILKADPV